MTAITELKDSKQREEASWPPPQGEWTFADYLRLPENEIHYEILEGEIFMSPSPVPRHQLALQTLLLLMTKHVTEHDLGALWLSPLDVVFPGGTTVVQPDLFFIAKEGEAIVTESNIYGIPDLVIEIVSSNSVKRDRRDKYNIYMKAGVPEYWIVDPQQKTLEVHVLRGETYVPMGIFRGNDNVHSEVLSGLSFSMKTLF